MRIISFFSVLILAAWPYQFAHGAVEAVVETRTFYSPDGSPMVEVNMAFLAGTMAFITNDRGFMQSRVEVITLIEQAGVIKAFGKTEVSGPERLDSIQVDLLHQEFFELEPGSYDLTVEVRDLGLSDSTHTTYQAPLVVGALPKGISVSDILLAERITPAPDGERSHYGYTVVPLLTDYFPPTLKTLSFYAEVHGSDQTVGKDSLYLLTYQIEGFESKAVFGPYKRSIRATGKPVEPVMAEFDIEQLPSGNYVLAIEALDRAGNLLVRREQFIQRNNPITYNYDLQAMDRLDLDGKFSGAFTNADTLAEHIASLTPIADPLERKIIADRAKDRDLDLMKRFFYSFWGNRSTDPEAAWAAYYQEVVKVNKLYGCRVLKGYETDRGRVYLQYGPPNTMMDRFNEMGTLPYTIWHFYRAGKFTNRRFIFYQPDRVTNCFQLLHSDMPGEVNNPQWNILLHTGLVPITDVQQTDPGTIESDRVRDFFNSPR